MKNFSALCASAQARDYIKIGNDVIYINSPLEKNIIDISTPSIQNGIT